MSYFGIFVALLFPLTLWAESVYVFKVQAKGLEAAEQETVQEVFISSVDGVDGFEAAETQTNSMFQLRGSVLKLGGSYIVKATKYKGREKLHSVRMKSTDLSDLDVVINRVVTSALNQTSVSGSAQVDTVTKDEEERSQRKYKATRQWQFGFGPATSSNLNDTGSAKMLSAGYNWSVDPDFDLQLVGDFYLPNENSDSNFLNVSIGLGYFLSRSKTAPFLGGGIGYGVASASDGSTLLSDDTASGWVGSFEAGVKFFRTSTVNLGLVLRYNLMFAKTDVSEKSPSTTVLKIVVYY